VVIRVSSMAILRKRSFISNVMSVWFLLNLRYIRSLVRFVELETIE